MNDRRLLGRLKRGEAQAFREFVRIHEGRVYNLVYRMLGDAAEAEDVAQEVFVAAYRNIKTFRGDAELGTWLYRLAVNQCKNRIRYHARRQQRASRPLDTVSEQALASCAAPQQSPRPDQAYAGRQLEDALQAAINALDEEPRMLVVLRDIQGLSYEAIGAITDLPQGTVKSRLHRARMALKDRLRRYL